MHVLATKEDVNNLKLEIEKTRSDGLYDKQAHI